MCLFLSVGTAHDGAVKSRTTSTKYKFEQQQQNTPTETHSQILRGGLKSQTEQNREEMAYAAYIY